MYKNHGKKIVKITVVFWKYEENRGKIMAFNLLHSMHSESHYSTVYSSSRLS